MLERASVGLLVAWIAWAATSAALAGHFLSPLSPYVGAPLSLAIGVVLGSRLSRLGDSWSFAWALFGLTGLLLVAELATAGPAKGPTGYANANAALAVQVVGLTGLALVGSSGRRRALLLVTAMEALGVVLANSSAGALVVGAPALTLTLVAAFRGVRRRRWVVVAMVVEAAAVLLVARAVTALAARPDWPTWATSTLDSARHSLWSDALHLWSAHPIVGVAPGMFERLSRLGHDPDTAAAHSSLLQVGAETGWTGVVLLAAIVVTGWLWATRGAPAYAVVSSAMWTALVVHSFVDHLVDFPAILLTAGAVIGWSARSRSSEELDISQGEGPGLR